MLTVKNSEIHPFVMHQADAFRSINKDKSLVKGVWEPAKYFDALSKANQSTRTAWFIQNDIFLKGYVEAISFERYQDREYTFLAKTNAVASEALKQLRSKLALLECGTALQLSQWLALRDYIEPERFNALLSLPKDVFPPLYLQHGAYILADLYEEIKIQAEEDILPGDLVYFKNISKYPQRHPIENGIGYNVVCVQANKTNPQETKFMGFDLDVDGNSSSEIEVRLFKEYTSEPLNPNVYLSKQAAQKIAPSTKDILTWEEFQKERSEDNSGVRGRLVLKVRRPRFDRLEQLKNTPPDQIAHLVKSWR